MTCQSEIVECILEQMHVMEENISRAKKGDIKVSVLVHVDKYSTCKFTSILIFIYNVYMLMNC